MAMNQQETTEELMEAVFLWSALWPLLCNGMVNTLYAVTNPDATIEVLLEIMFSTRPVQRVYKEYN
jgi:hypothetical protein